MKTKHMNPQPTFVTFNCKRPCLSVSFHSSGAVELENLPLRKDALREFDLPFEVKAGETQATFKM